MGWGWGCGCVCHRGPLRSVRPRRRPLDMASERRQVLWYACYGLCSSQQVKPGSGWQEQQGAAAAEVAAGRGCGTARLRQRPKAGSGVGGKWQKKVGGSSEVAAAARGVGVGVWVCVPPWPSAQCAPAAPSLDMASERRQVLWYACYGLCSSQQVKPGSGWQRAARRGCGRGGGGARLRHSAAAAETEGRQWRRRQVAEEGRWKQRGGGSGTWGGGGGCGCVCHRGPLRSVRPRRRPWTWPPSVARYCGMHAMGCVAASR